MIRERREKRSGLTSCHVITAGGLTPWEKYLQEKKERRKEAKRKKARKQEESGEGKTAESSFDDPFFHHSVTTATAVSELSYSCCIGVEICVGGWLTDTCQVCA